MDPRTRKRPALIRQRTKKRPEVKGLCLRAYLLPGAGCSGSTTSGNRELKTRCTMAMRCNLASRAAFTSAATCATQHRRQVDAYRTAATCATHYRRQVDAYRTAASMRQWCTVFAAKSDGTSPTFSIDSSVDVSRLCRLLFEAEVLDNGGSRRVRRLFGVVAAYQDLAGTVSPPAPAPAPAPPSASPAAASPLAPSTPPPSPDSFASSASSGDRREGQWGGEHEYTTCAHTCTCRHPVADTQSTCTYTYTCTHTWLARCTPSVGGHDMQRIHGRTPHAPRRSHLRVLDGHALQHLAAVCHRGRHGPRKHSFTKSGIMDDNVKEAQKT